MIQITYAALADLGAKPVADEEKGKPQPAVSVRKSLSSPDKIISMIDGRPYSTLKRHLSTHGYTPETYRKTFDLKADYPMVAPAYTERRKELAKVIGLGRKPKQGANKAEAAAAGVAPKRARRKTGMEALAEVRSERS